MKKLLRQSLMIMVFMPFAAKAQFETFKDTVVQLYGVVMTADSLRGLPAVSILVKGTGRGTLTNGQGVFSIVVLKGDEIEFSCIGFKNKITTAVINEQIYLIDGQQRYEMIKQLYIRTSRLILDDIISFK
jgi:hypothetical protein